MPLYCKGIWSIAPNDATHIINCPVIGDTFIKRDEYTTQLYWDHGEWEITPNTIDDDILTLRPVNYE